MKWLFLSIYPLLPEGSSVLSVPKVNGCSPCGSNVRDFFLVHFYELLRGKFYFFVHPVNRGCPTGAELQEGMGPHLFPCTVRASLKHSSVPLAWSLTTLH